MDPKVCCQVKNSRDREISSNIPKQFVEKNVNLKLLPNDLCGPIPEARIFGGKDTKIYEFPWMALLGYFIGRKEIDFRCGGTLINENYILTAAHCVTGLPLGFKLVKVRIGEHNLATEIDCESEDNCAERYQEFPILFVISHDSYSKKTLENDIALVKLRGTVDFHSTNIRPICLPLDLVTLTPASAIATGWGATEFGRRSEILKKVTLPVVPESECRKAYENFPFVKISDKQICAGGLKGMDSCLGDSGGPLQAISNHGHRPSYVQYGIVSYGTQKCGLEGTPGVYTRVSHYIPWILDNIN